MVKERILHKGRKVYPIYPNQNIIQQANNTWDLGSSTRQFKNLWVDGKAYIDQLGESVQLSGGANILPERDDSSDIGSATAQFKNAWIDGELHADTQYVDTIIVSNEARMRYGAPAASGLGSFYVNGTVLYVYTSGAAARVWASRVLL